jgi:hypothetical protein
LVGPKYSNKKSGILEVSGVFLAVEYPDGVCFGAVVATDDDGDDGDGDDDKSQQDIDVEREIPMVPYFGGDECIASNEPLEESLGIFCFCGTIFSSEFLVGRTREDLDMGIAKLLLGVWGVCFCWGVFSDCFGRKKDCVVGSLFMRKAGGSQSSLSILFFNFKFIEPIHFLLRVST